jgi:hypothetical protein
VVDVADRSAPVLIATLALRGEPTSIAIGGGIGCVAANTAGIHVLDLSDPRAPVPIAWLDTPGLARKVAVRDSVAYVADGTALAVVSLEDPSNPVRLGELNAQDFAAGVALAEGYVFVADGWAGIEVVRPQCPLAGGTSVQGMVSDLRLHPAIPNPMRSSASIRFEIGHPATVVLDLLDVTGRRIRRLLSTPMESGPHEVVWDGCGEDRRLVAGGVYFARLATGRGAEVERIVRLR